MKVIARQGESLDALCFRVMGKTAGVVEKVLELNPGLADKGVILPHGTTVELPNETLVTNEPIIQLWN